MIINLLDHATHKLVALGELLHFIKVLLLLDVSVLVLFLQDVDSLVQGLNFCKHVHRLSFNLLKHLL